MLNSATVLAAALVVSMIGCTRQESGDALSPITKQDAPDSSTPHRPSDRPIVQAAPVRKWTEEEAREFEALLARCSLRMKDSGGYTVKAPDLETARRLQALSPSIVILNEAELEKRK